MLITENNYEADNIATIRLRCVALLDALFLIDQRVAAFEI